MRVPAYDGTQPFQCAGERSINNDSPKTPAAPKAPAWRPCGINDPQDIPRPPQRGPGLGRPWADAPRRIILTGAQGEVVKDRDVDGYRPMRPPAWPRVVVGVDQPAGESLAACLMTRRFGPGGSVLSSRSCGSLTAIRARQLVSPDFRRPCAACASYASRWRPSTAPRIPSSCPAAKSQLQRRGRQRDQRAHTPAFPLRRAPGGAMSVGAQPESTSATAATPTSGIHRAPRSAMRERPTVLRSSDGACAARFELALDQRYLLDKPVGAWMIPERRCRAVPPGSECLGAAPRLMTRPPSPSSASRRNWRSDACLTAPARWSVSATRHRADQYVEGCGNESAELQDIPAVVAHMPPATRASHAVVTRMESQPLHKACGPVRRAPGLEGDQLQVVARATHTSSTIIATRREEAAPVAFEAGRFH
jgi:hypothetical protein